MGDRHNLDRFVDESRASQRNIVFPDTVRNGRSVDVFFWRGSPNPTVVQRIAAWLFGLFWMAMGSAWLAGTLSAHNKRDNEGLWITAAIAVPCYLVGIRIFCNGFPRRAKTAQKSN